MEKNISHIYFFCPEDASGGIKIMYHHVDILNARGFSASILHCHTGHRCNWFENQTKISYLKQVKFKPEDILVFPEVVAAYFTKEMNPKGLKRWIKRIFSETVHKYYTYELAQLPLRKVIFNQGTYYTFFKFPLTKNSFRIPYLQKDVVATVGVSADNQQYLQYIFPEHPVFRVFLSINSGVFGYSPKKEKQIAYMTRKSPEDLRQVINILNIKGLLKDFELKLIHKNSEAEVAQILQKSMFFLSFGAAESFPLLPLEAMSCGAVVIGYHGRGGKEYFNPDFCYPVESGDIIGFAKAVEEAIREYEKNPEKMIEKGKKAAETIKNTYSFEKEIASVVEIWEKIIAMK